MNIGSLFSGIGGLDMAVAHVFNAEISWFCEYEAAPRSVLERHYPGIPIHSDVRTLNEPEPVDILCGGYPCQPFSKAGSRKGTDDERHLWPEFARLIRLLRPQYAVLENVAGHLSLGFDEVLADLAEAGFDAEWMLVRASDAGAPHRRERLFCIAYANGERRMERQPQEQPAVGGQPPLPESPQRDRETPTDAHGGRREQRDPSKRGLSESDEIDPVVADADLAGGEAPGRRSGTGDARRLQPVESDGAAVEWKAYAPAIERWEQLTRPAPSPVDSRGALAVPFVEWMMGFPEGWVDGLSRTHALKALGNAVVPQQASLALSRILMDRLLRQVEAS